MDVIDWSKAPEWATVRLRNVADSSLLAWAESYNTGSRFKRDDFDSESPSLIIDAWTQIAMRPSSPAWNGEGLPPVGTVCEVMDADIGDWISGTIVHVGLNNGCTVAIMQCEKEVQYGYSGEFRPIRTPEQIAAEEREAAIQAMYGLSRTSSIADVLHAQHRLCADLYDAGYRKQEQPK